MKTILITGASGNLGGTVVQLFLEKGWQVAGAYHAQSENPLPDTHDTLHAHAVDLGIETAATEWVGSVLSKYDKLDAAVLAVGGFTQGGLGETDSEDLFLQYRLNFETAYHVARPVFLHMREQGHGRLFFIGAGAALDPQQSRNMLAYSLSKSLLFRLAEILNAEAGELPLYTHVLVPSTLDTPANRFAMPESDFSQWVKPETVAERIFSLCQQADKGQEIVHF